MRFRTLVVTLALLTLAATPALAQRRGARPQHQLTVLGGLSLQDVSSTDAGILLPLDPGINTLPLQTTTIGVDGSAELGVRYGYRVADRIVIEADFSVAPSHTLEQRIEFDCPAPILCIAGPRLGPELFVPDVRFTRQLTAYHYGGGARIALTDGPVRPSIIGGVGAVTYDGATLNRTSATLRLGGAVAADAGAFTTTIEVVDVIVADHFATNRAEHDVHVRFGIGVRW